MTNISSDRVAGALYGLAFGDAYGYQVEFTKHHEIVARYGLIGPDFPRPARVSDDTQMSLAVWHALDSADIDDDASLTDSLLREFLMWSVDDDNTRAPGITCMGSLERLADGRPWATGTHLTSKGCGTVMRAPWIGLHPRVAPHQVSRVAQLQAALTHGHPTAVLAADVLAKLTRALAVGAVELAHAAHYASVLAENLDYSPVLGDLWRHCGDTDPDDYVADGAWELAEVLAPIPCAVRTLRQDPLTTDPCALTGDGWTADTALATALLITTTFGHKPVLAIRRAATTGGDSDSIAAIVGALLGAAHGDVWPADWRGQLEPRYRRELAVATATTTV